MKQNKINLIVSSILIVLTTVFATPTLSPVLVHAQNSNTTSSGGDKVQEGLGVVGDAFPEGAKRAKDLKELVHLIINWALYIAAMAAVIMIIVGGYQYLFSAGNAASAGKGRTTMINALIGLTIIVLSFVIVQVVYYFLTRETI